MQDVHTRGADLTGTDGRIAHALLAWYRREGRTLPWRAPPGNLQDPYKVWLSEIMLQQTTVKAVTPRYIDFLRRWPDVTALARAELGDVLAAWAGLGYYARARNLHVCARAVAETHGGRFPDTEDALRQLPGIGAYTSAAIAAIAFGRHAAPVDGNIERVIARLFAIETPLPAAKPEIKALAERLTPAKHPGDFAQGLMDLGASICTPRRPACGLCPLRSFCHGFVAGLTEQLPYKAAKAERPTRRGMAFVAIREDGAVLLRERPPKGLLGGMQEVPSTPWVETAPEHAIEKRTPLRADWKRVPGLVTHTFTHFHLELTVYRAEAGQDPELTPAADPERCSWVGQRALPGAALPSVMRKVLAHALGEGGLASKTRGARTSASGVPRRGGRRSA
ncbi:MAG: A/G-specific adenine glycosylase [Methyloceanibacter sp.]|uniref:A/G-specific adenine glycosylase n=1 Tax=Methyloceanibacter sp. TaxID=1965321 RepID=UPI001D23AAC4|nr:A/G-specific adenine glycosylase [Methyloceanibacter sp.]MCB1441549.1 A/G-specific adenine glycosylase [Methyloceanibacter sp.]